MLENLEQWGFVKMIANWLSSEAMSRKIVKFIEMVEQDTLGHKAMQLLGWAIFIIVLATVIDWVFYLMRPEQRMRLLRMHVRFRKLTKWFKDQFNRPRSGVQRPR